MLPIVAHSVKDMQDITEKFSKSAHDFDLQINMSETRFSASLNQEQLKEHIKFTMIVMF